MNLCTTALIKTKMGRILYCGYFDQTDRNKQQYFQVNAFLIVAKSFLSSSPLLQCQMNECTIVHVVISQRVGILDENALIKENILVRHIARLKDRFRYAWKPSLPRTATSVSRRACP